jgi:hypothetical protein
MITKALSGLLSAVLIAALMWPAASSGAEGSTPSMLGTPTISFSLASTQDRLINYGSDYYGRHNLIVTFFPAAYTPV